MASPRPGDNVFRAMRDSDVENVLLFREQPRQLAVLGLVVAAVSYYSFTHDSQVRARTRAYGDWRETRGLMRL